jgi:hypothetical protein
MERAMATTDIEHVDAEVEIPRPRPNGSYTIENLGGVVDRLTGVRAIRKDAAAYLEPFLARDEEIEGEPEPVDIPAPRPGGSEDVTRGGRPDRS